MKTLCFTVILLLTFVGVAHATPATPAHCDVKYGIGCIQHHVSAGWVRFCPISQEIANGEFDGHSDYCVNVRPERFYERDAAGAVIVNHSIAAIGTPLLMGTRSGTFDTACSAANNYVCATSSAGNGTVGYEAADYQITLWSGEIFFQFTAYIFQADGTITFGTTTVPIYNGSFKFDMNLANYVFCGYGVNCDGNVGYSAEIRMQVVPLKKLTPQHAYSGLQGLYNFPQYWSSNGTGAAQFQTVEIKALENNVLSYTFQGPFNRMHYDPLVPNGAGTVSAIAAGLMAVLIVIMF